jgi:hypothetical protein
MNFLKKYNLLNKNNNTQIKNENPEKKNFQIQEKKHIQTQKQTQKFGKKLLNNQIQLKEENKEIKEIVKKALNTVINQKKVKRYNFNKNNEKKEREIKQEKKSIKELNVNKRKSEIEIENYIEKEKEKENSSCSSFLLDSYNENKENINLNIIKNNENDNSNALINSNPNFINHEININIIEKISKIENYKKTIKVYNHKINRILMSNYGGEIFESMKDLDNLMQIPSDFMKNHDIIPDIRTKMVDWMVEVLSVYKCSQETFFLSVFILDLYIYKSQRQRIIKTEEIHGLGLTCMFIASKFEDLNPIRMQKILINIGHNIFKE